jgi:hypothetical protein
MSLVWSGTHATIHHFKFHSTKIKHLLPNLTQRLYVLKLQLNYHLNSIRSSGVDHFGPSLEVSSLTFGIMDLQFLFQPHFNILIKTKCDFPTSMTQFVFFFKTFDKRDLLPPTKSFIFSHQFSIFPTTQHKYETIAISHLEFPKIQVSFPFTHINFPTFPMS